jgi:hypothetical protein
MLLEHPNMVAESFLILSKRPMVLSVRPNVLRARSLTLLTIFPLLSNQRLALRARAILVNIAVLLLGICFITLRAQTILLRGVAVTLISKPMQVIKEFLMRSAPVIRDVRVSTPQCGALGLRVYPA